MLKNFLFVALGGALGASLRYGVALLGTYLGSSRRTIWSSCRLYNRHSDTVPDIGLGGLNCRPENKLAYIRFICAYN